MLDYLKLLIILFGAVSCFWGAHDIRLMRCETFHESPCMGLMGFPEPLPH